MQSKDLISAKRALRKELVGDAEFIYVYHNKIDSIGEEYSTEHMVFEACDTAIDDIVALVKIATGDLNFSRVIITADHGFLYTRDPLEAVTYTHLDVYKRQVRCSSHDMLRDRGGF